MSDADLVRQVLNGQKRAYEVLVQRWCARLIGFLYGRVGRADVAEDLAQESLLRAYRSLATLDDPARFGSWLLSIGHRAALDWLKAKARQECSLDQLQAPGGNGRRAWPSDVRPPDEVCQDQEERQRLRHAMDQLPSVLREVLYIYYYDRASYKTMAQMLGVSTATINARLTKARMMLREQLAAERETP